MKREVVMVLMAGGLLAGCTTSIGGASDFSVAIEEGAGDVQQLLDAYGKPKTTIIEVPSAEFRDYVQDVPKNVVVLGVDDSFGVSNTTPYGSDYACVVANNSWFAVNRVTPPTGMDALTNAAYAAYVDIPNPKDSVDEAWFLANSDAEKLLGDLKKNGATLGTADGAIIVGSALLPWREANNIKTDSQWTTLPDTCVARPVVAVGTNPEFLEFLVSAGPLLADSGIAYPLQESVPQDVARLAPRPEVTPVSTEDAPERYREVEDTWNKLTTGLPPQSS